MNYLKSFVFVIAPMLILSFLVALLYHFNILSNSIYNVFKIVVPILSFFIGGVYLGKHSKEKGWLEGLKFGTLFVILFFMISFLGFNVGLSFKSFIYYIIILFSSMLGAMFGIRNVEENE